MQEQEIVHMIEGCKREIKLAELRAQENRKNLAEYEALLAEAQRVPVRHKTLAEQERTIEVFGFGIENYEVINGTFMRVRGRAK